jgi:hypothetical protein
MIAILFLALTLCATTIPGNELNVSDDDNTFVAFGTVTDPNGNPVANATVRVATGIGTLVGGASTKTDEDGKFKLSFGPGMRTTVNPEWSPLGVGVQAAKFNVKKEAMKLDADEVLHYLMSDLTPEKFDKMLADSGGKYWGKSDASEVIFANTPKEINFVMIKETLGANRKDADKVVWGKSRKGLVAGAKLLSATGELDCGDPIVVQFVLKNDSKEKRSIVLKRTQEIHPVIGEDNRLELNVLGSSQETAKHNLEPGETLEDARYRVTVSTDGMAAGEYRITSRTAFWMVKDGKPNAATGIPFGKSIPIELGQSEAVTTRTPPDDGKTIWWGKPTANLILGMRLVDDRKFWPNDDVDIEGQLFLFNSGDEVLELSYQLPTTPSGWNMHVTAEGEKSVRLDWTWFTGIEPTRDRTVNIEPGQSIPLTGIEAAVSTGDKAAKIESIQGPLLRILKEKTDFEYGDPKRLIGKTGKFYLNAAVTIRPNGLADPVIVASSAPVPFEIEKDGKAIR